MTNKSTTLFLDPQDLLDEMEAQAELVLERGFALQFEPNMLVLTYKNKAVVFAQVELMLNQDEKEVLDVQVSTVLNADLDVDTVSSNVATLQAAGQVVRKAFEQKQYQIISQ
jgi:hypothetical protein